MPRLGSGLLKPEMKSRALPIALSWFLSKQVNSGWAPPVLPPAEMLKGWGSERDHMGGGKEVCKVRHGRNSWERNSLSFHLEEISF